MTTDAILDELLPAPAGGIVAGDDGSAHAYRALETAFGLADRLDRPLLVVRTWTIDTLPHGVLVDHGLVASFDEVSDTIAALEVARSEVLASRHPEVVVTYRALSGQAGEVLTRLSRDASMIVVGSRGLGGVAGLLVGSVSSDCVRHAHCPVLVVPAEASAHGIPVTNGPVAALAGRVD